MTDPAAEDARYGWAMVGVTFVLTGFAFGGLGAVGVFLKPLAAEFGWSRGEVALGYTVMTCSSAVMGVVWGFAADRFGCRPLSLLGMAASGVAFLLLGQTASLWQYYAFYFLFGAFGHAAISVPLYANVGSWFTRNLGLAMGLMASGSAAGQAVVPFLGQLLISQYDWQTAYTVLGIGYLALGLPVALLVRDSPARLAARRAGAGPDEAVFPLPPAEVVGWISVAVIFCCICMSVPIVHVVPLISDRGIGPEAAASVLAVLMAAGAVGRILGGRLADMIGALKAYMAMSLAQTSLVVWFPVVAGLAGAYLLAAPFGIAYSGVMAGILICLNVMVPARVAARAMGIGAMFGWFGMGAGGYLGGLLFDLTGGYAWSYGAAGLAGVVNLAILAAFHLRVERRTHRVTVA